VVIGPDSEIGAGVRLHAGVVIGARVRVGEGSTLRANCVIEDGCEIGRGVVLHPGVVVGADGFGYRPGAEGLGLVKVPHAGNVVVEDGAEIGANTTIDRGKLGPTVIGAGAKIDNLVQIGHNCVIGRCCIICGCTALAGSVTIGDGTVIGGGVGVADNVRIGAGARIAAKSGVMRDVPDGETWAGYPAQKGSLWMRTHAATIELTEHIKPLKRLLRRRQEADDERR
jgi:UDP-3-O-[3-hydroxymyristoyl] glucosamine N-acyltransferase